MGRSNKAKSTPNKPVIVENKPSEGKPDLTPGEAINVLKTEILDECFKIEEGKIKTVFPLVKMVRQLKELNASASRSVQ